MSKTYRREKTFDDGKKFRDKHKKRDNPKSLRVINREVYDDNDDDVYDVDTKPYDKSKHTIPYDKEK
jgi:hypothetical protein